MALLPDIHFNFDQLTFERVYQIFLPLIPGCTIVGGLILAHPHSAYAMATTLGLGRYSRVAVLLCGVYVAGLILYGFSIAVIGNCSILLTQFVYKKWPPIRANLGSSQSVIFRRVATEFLGTLTPLPAGKILPAIAGNDVEWQDFYNVLQDYVLKGIPTLHNELLLLITYLQATGWALVYLYWRTEVRGHWSVLVVSFTLILFTASFPFVVQFFYWKYDRVTPWDFIARLINEIKVREKSSAAASQQVVK